MLSAKVIKKTKAFGGDVLTLKHNSDVLGCEMKFTLFYPPRSNDTPIVFFLSGLTCNHENFITKGCAIEYASKNNLCLVCPDTSPRGDSVPDSPAEDDCKWDFGIGSLHFFSFS